jgi:hypothetical protein
MSMVFGIVFALAVGIFRLRRLLLVVGAALVYGLALYVVNFQVIGARSSRGSSNPNGPNQTFAVWIHPIGHGLFLAPFFLTLRREARHV